MKDLTERSNCDMIELTKPQIAFLEYCKEFGWGKLEVVIKGGEPRIARIVEQTIKFD